MFVKVPVIGDPILDRSLIIFVHVRTITVLAICATFITIQMRLSRQWGLPDRPDNLKRFRVLFFNLFTQTEYAKINYRPKQSLKALCLFPTSIFLQL
jgi:hypothetical protein